MKVGIQTKVLVVDVSDTALQSMREYDPVTDMHEDIRSFLDERPFDLPALRVKSVIFDRCGTVGGMDFFGV